MSFLQEQHKYQMNDQLVLTDLLDELDDNKEEEEAQGGIIGCD